MGKDKEIERDGQGYGDKEMVKDMEIKRYLRKWR